jgi:hypothetical protein
MYWLGMRKNKNKKLDMVKKDLMWKPFQIFKLKKN